MKQGSCSQPGYLMVTWAVMPEDFQRHFGPTSWGL